MGYQVRFIIFILAGAFIGGLRQFTADSVDRRADKIIISAVIVAILYALVFLIVNATWLKRRPLLGDLLCCLLGGSLTFVILQVFYDSLNSVLAWQQFSWDLLNNEIASNMSREMFAVAFAAATILYTVLG